MTPAPLVFFGTDAFSVPSLIRLLAENWDIRAVVTKPDSHTGRGRELTIPAVKRLALAKNIPVLQPAQVSEIVPGLKKLKPAAGIVVAYGKLIRPDVLRVFPRGLINIHASLLPRHRGPSPIETAILDGDAQTGVTLMQIDEGMDTGPTYDSFKLHLAGNETRLELYERLAEAGAELLSNKLPAILEGNIVPIPQDAKLATKTKLISKSDGQVNWSESAELIERKIRAYLGWPGCATTIAGTPATITAGRSLAQNGTPGHAFKTAAGELAVYAGVGAIIIDLLKPAGKREMAGPEFLAGHRL